MSTTLKRRIIYYAMLAVSFLAGVVPPVVYILRKLPLWRETNSTSELVVGTVFLIGMILFIPCLRVLKRMKSPAPWVLFTLLFLGCKALQPLLPSLISVFGLAAVSFFVSWIIWQVAQTLMRGWCINRE